MAGEAASRPARVVRHARPLPTTRKGEPLFKATARIVLALAVAAAALATLGAASSSASDRASYIVVLKSSVANPAAVAQEHAARFGGTVSHVYSHALKGYSLTLPAAAVARIAADPRVDYVEADGVMTADTTQSGATWGIDRIDQRSLPLSGTYTYFATGSGVKAYIIDTGIRFTHTQFGGRAIKGVDEVTASGSASGVIAGVDWVTGNHLAGQSAVANMSLGGGASSSLDTAVNNSINDGVSYAIAAGNGDAFGNPLDACTVSPARVGAAMTISATDRTDTRASWANYGNCVDWFAPGVSITSAWYSSDTATNTISGTSMATPHTTGVAALYLQTHAGASPATVRSALYNLTTKSIVKSSLTTNNHLPYTNF